MEKFILRKGERTMAAPKKKTNKKPVFAQNRKFNSITEFCQEFGLKYSSVNAQLRKGRSGDQVLETLGYLPAGIRYNDTPTHSQRCSYNGIEYPSLVTASDTLGIPMDKIISLQKQGNLSLDDAIAKAVEENEQLKEKGTDNNKSKKHVGEIVIDNVTYKSMQEALLVYGVPYITVKSRMARDGISFEEALCRGKKERRHIMPYKSDTLYKIINDEEDLAVLCEEVKMPDNDKDIIVCISNILSKNTYKPKAYYYSASQTGIICFYENLHAISEKRMIMLSFIYPQDYYPLQVEISIPNLLSLRNSPNIDYNKLLEKINELQSKYLNAVINFSNKKISVRWLYTITSESINIRQFFITINRFIGTASTIFDELKCLIEESSN